MSEGNSTGRRVTVRVQLFPDRPHLMLQWHDPVTGKRKSRTAGTCNPLDAEKKRADLEYELNHGLYQEPSRITWERFRELFEAEYVSARRKDTRKNYYATLDLFERLCEPKLLRSIDVRVISAFASALRKQPGYGGGTMQPSTVKVRLQFLRTALNWAAAQRCIPECPPFPDVKVPKKKPQPVPPESFERLLAKAPDAHMRAYLLTGWLAGLRLNEALELEWEETTGAPYLDPARHRIVFPAEFVKAVEDQWIPLDPELWQALDALPRVGRKVFHFGAIDGRGDRRLTDKTVSARVRDLAKAAGVKLTMKSLRRGFGCRYAGKVPAQVLQKLMRHSNIAITMTYYANTDDAMMDAVLGKKEDRPPQPADPGLLEQKGYTIERNALRNTAPETPAELPNPGDVTPSPEGGSS
jgi:integrase